MPPPTQPQPQWTPQQGYPSQVEQQIQQLPPYVYYDWANTPAVPWLTPVHYIPQPVTAIQQEFYLKQAVPELVSTPMIRQRGFANSPINKMQQVVSAKASMLQLVSDLRSPMRRDAAMVELLRRKEWVHDLGPALWNTCGVMAALLDEIFDVYRLLDPPALSSRVSYRVCNVLGLFRAIAASPQSSAQIFNAQYIPALIPLLQPPSRTESYENVRVATMEIIIELLKYNELAVVSQLLSTEMIPLALRMMTEGSELAQSYSTFIILKILQDNFGLSYVCNFRLERVEAVAQAVSGALGYIAYHRSSRLLRYSLQCYLQLCDHILARDLLRRGRLIPQSITDGTLWNFLAEDDFATKSLFERLLDILSVQ